MPLPTAETPWPPKPLRPVLDTITRYDAWYGGEPDTLALVMGRAPDPNENRPSRRAKFWQRPVQVGQRDDRLHLPLPADIAQVSSDLLFAELPAFTLEDATAQARLAEVLEEGGAHNRLMEAAEVGAALGGVYLKADWATDVADVPLLSSVHADCAVPEFAYGLLRAVTFWREVDVQGGQVLRYLERHDVGRIEHALYQGTRETLGRRVPLTEHPDTAGLAEGLDSDAGDARQTGIDALTAAYVPNVLPNRGKLRGQPHGRSDFQQLEPWFDALDETWTSWMRDLRLAKARLVVPRGYLDNQGRGRGSTFDVDRELYEGLEMPPPSMGAGNASGTGITLVQFAIRVDEHQRTAEQIVRTAIETAGYSAASFGITDEGQAMTATEVTAKTRRSMTTRQRKAGYWRPALRHMAYVLLALDAEVFRSGVTPAKPGCEFGDGVAEDPGELAATLNLLAQAEAASTETKVRMLHPDWDDDQVAEEVERIKDDAAGPPLADPAQLGRGGEGLADPAEDAGAGAPARA